MVDVLGHLAMTLFATIPVWFIFSRRAALAFVGFALLAAMLPDIDLYLPWVAHHGVTHTLLFVGLVGVAGGGVVALAAPDILRRWSPWAGEPAASRLLLFGFAVCGLVLGGTVHVVFDMLSTSSTGQVVRPFWPAFEKPFSVYVITTFSQPAWNSIPFAFAVLLHAALYRRVATAS
jgi:hypothetical protein